MTNAEDSKQNSNQEIMEYDVLIVGAGPSGLSAAIRLAQLATQHQYPIKICVIEKGSEVGAHILSGAVFEPRALNELLPDWKAKGAPLETAAINDEFRILSSVLGKHFSIPLPVPPQMNNHGNYIISLENLCQWLAKQAESLGVDIFPGFAASDVLYNEQGHVNGITTNAVGIAKDHHKKANYQPGMQIKAKYLLLAEGARGSLTKTLCERFALRSQSDPQTYGIGIKELWEVDLEKTRQYFKPGKVLHTVGWPLNAKTYGGSFIYHMKPNFLSIGFVVGLDYENTYLDPFEEFQRFKHHPLIRPLLEGGRRVCFGARALNEGGLQAIPTLSFPGGLLIGCAAGFLNVPKIKGSHTAMKSGMLAAEAVFSAIKEQKGPIISDYEKMIRSSWIWDELYLARNIRPSFRINIWSGLLYSAIDTYLFRGRAPWTFHLKKSDYQMLKRANQCKKIVYPKPDGIISFDKLSSVQLSNTHHQEDQPSHLLLKDPNLPIQYNLAFYDAPEQRYCPAMVYEIIKPNLEINQGNPYLQINAANCVHCKTCDIKDPKQNITWVPPEGGGGPNYTNM